MAKKKVAQDVDTVELETPQENNNMADSNIDTPDAPPVQSTSSDTGDRGIIDLLDENCPIEDLRDRFTDEQKIAILELIDRGAIIREEREIVIKKDAGNLPEDAIQKYWGYVPTGVSTDLQGNPISEFAGMRVLSNDKVRLSTKWSKDQKATTPEQKAQKDSDESKGACDHWDYGNDLNIRTMVRSYLSSQLGGPMAEIAKAVKGMFTLKIAKTQQKAFDLVMANRRENGDPIPDGLTLEALKINWGKGK